MLLMFHAVFNAVLGIGAAVLATFSNKSRILFCIVCLLLLLTTLLLSVNEMNHLHKTPWG